MCLPLLDLPGWRPDQLSVPTRLERENRSLKKLEPDNTVDLWPGPEEFTHDLNHWRHQRRNTTRAQGDTASLSSESEDGNEDVEPESEYTEELTLTLARDNSSEGTGIQSSTLVPPPQRDGGMRATLEARRSRIIGDVTDTRLPPDLAVSVALSLAKKEKVDFTPRTAPFTFGENTRSY